MLLPNATFESVSGRRYVVRRHLAHGGQGVAYVVEDAAGRPFVMKVLEGEFQPAVMKLRCQLLIRRRLHARSPTLCADIDLVDQGGMLASLAPLAQGESLASLLENRPLPLLQSLQVGCAIAQGVAVLEELVIAHGDLHAGNVMVHVDAEAVRSVQLIDFGNFVAPEAPAPPCFGQAYYLAPEIRLEGRLPDMFSDRYALATLLHEVVLLKHPAAGFEDHYDRAVAEWLHDPARCSSRENSSGGYATEILNADLARLFRLGVSASRLTRPAASAWVEALADAMYRVSTCPNCGAPAIVDSSKSACPACRRPYPTLLLRTPQGTVPLVASATVIGREELGDDPSISRRHAIIRRQGPDYVLEDQSTNGTYRQTETGWTRLDNRSPLPLVQAGDVLRFAAVETSLEMMP